MCGIFAAMIQRGVEPWQIDRARSSLSHRGPDGNGVWLSTTRKWVLGHTRLSIIGLGNGEQPFSSGNGKVHAVVNGEFYGYREIRSELREIGCQFSTESDSEIALHLYLQQGMQLTSKLRGEFAFVIADEREGVMIAVRDRFGIKPLYYAERQGDIFFASEIKAILAMGIPASWDLKGAMDGASRPHEQTDFSGINAVPPGCYAIAKDGIVRIYSYWDWEIPTKEDMLQDTRSDSEVVSGFRHVLMDSVQRRLVADVEVACYLSGGIDSCSVLGLAQQSMRRPIRAFTVTFDNPLYDEGALAEKQAEFVGASYQPVPVTERDIADAYPDAIWHAETQMFNGHGVAKFLLSKAIRDAGIKVVFTGEGADEMLGGYSFFRVDAITHNCSLSQTEKSVFIDKILGTNETTRALMLPKLLTAPDTDAAQCRLGWVPTFIKMAAAMTDGLSGFYTDDYAAHIKNYSPVAAAMDRMPIGQRVLGRDHLNQALYISVKTILPNAVLSYLGDRMEMAHSIEGRVPYLDHHVAEYSARIPVDMKIKGIREKNILREAAKDMLIPEVYNRQKKVFMTPPIKNKNNPMSEFYLDIFSSQAATLQPFYDLKKINAGVEKLFEAPADQWIAIEGRLQRIASVIIMQEKFGMS